MVASNSQQVVAIEGKTERNGGFEKDEKKERETGATIF